MSESPEMRDIPDEAIVENRLRTAFMAADERWRSSTEKLEKSQEKTEEELAENRRLAEERMNALDPLRAIGVDPTLVPEWSAEEEAEAHRRVLEDLSDLGPDDESQP